MAVVIGLTATVASAGTSEFNDCTMTPGEPCLQLTLNTGGTT
jgi:hypothetical protein